MNDSEPKFECPYCTTFFNEFRFTMPDLVTLDRFIIGHSCDLTGYHEIEGKSVADVERKFAMKFKEALKRKQILRIHRKAV